PRKTMPASLSWIEYWPFGLVSGNDPAGPVGPVGPLAPVGPVGPIPPCDPDELHDSGVSLPRHDSPGWSTRRTPAPFAHAWITPSAPMSPPAAMTVVLPSVNARIAMSRSRLNRIDPSPHSEDSAEPTGASILGRCADVSLRSFGGFVAPTETH